MVRIPGESCWLCWPAWTDGLLRGESVQRRASRRDGSGPPEARPVGFQVLVGEVARRLHGGFLACPVPAFSVAIGPGMGGFGQPMVTALRTADASADRAEGLVRARAVGAREAVLGEHGVDRVGHGGFGPIGAACTCVRCFDWAPVWGLR
jgi:hypothetical protein